MSRQQHPALSAMQDIIVLGEHQEKLPVHQARTTTMPTLRQHAPVAAKDFTAQDSPLKNLRAQLVHTIMMHHLTLLVKHVPLAPSALEVRHLLLLALKAAGTMTQIRQLLA